MGLSSTSYDRVPARKLRVVQVVDSLAPAGTEKCAVNLANSLAEMGHESHLCSTRAEGPLAAIVKPGVGRLRLNRTCCLAPQAFIAFTRYLNQRRIEILHAHSSSVFTAVVGAALSSSAPRVVWHFHQGRLAQRLRPPLHMRLASRRVASVIAVSRPLADWAIEKLGMPPQQVRYIPNYVRIPPGKNTAAELPGTPGFRIVSVANLRPEKDTLNLLAAMTLVLAQIPQARLLLVGNSANHAYSSRVKAEVLARQLSGAVCFLGSRDDISHLLPCCDVAVLSSVAEGFPLTLLEYGAAGLPTVSTRVGACAEILEDGRAGLLVSPSAPDELASAIVTLLRSRELRQSLGAAFRSRVEREYGQERILNEVTEVYRRALSC